MRLFANANYDFIGRRRLGYLISAALIVPGLLLLLIRGVNYSVEFTGGTLMQVESTVPVDVGAVRGALATAGLPTAELQTFGSERELVIRARVARAGTDANDTQATSDAVRAALDQTIGAGKYSVVRTEAVGPKVGSELRQKAVIAILLSFAVVLIYLAIRFEWRFGVAAVIATAHDIVASLAFIGLTRLEVSLFVVAALLTIVGYSLNDTIVIFDRIRENLHKSKREEFIAVLNRSMNETLPRTFFTGTTAVGSLVALSALGGDVVRPFAILMLFGVAVGTFSSLFIAAPALLAIERKWPGEDVRGVRTPGKAPQRPTSGRPSPAHTAARHRTRPAT
ncbi:MAG TPA: protein translocase subunit SecF [Gemmatimonadales bacterium]|nr:protein translocase subunit SecF [Gemmatimonadales bacterium]